MAGEPDYADERQVARESYRVYLETMDKQRLVDIVLQHYDMQMLE